MNPTITEEMEHVRIPVILRDGSNDGKGKLVFLKVEDVCSVTTDGRVLVFETNESTYHALYTLDDVGQFLAPAIGLEKIDRVNYIQPKHVTHYDSNYRKIYFESPVQPQSKFATIAKRHVGWVMQFFGRENDLANR